MSIIRLKLPLPPAGKKFCAACAALAKGRFVQMHQAEMQRLDRDGDPATIVDFRLTNEDIGLIETAVAQGIWPLMQQYGVLDLCWSHLMPVTINIQSLPTARPGDEEAVAKALEEAGAPVLGRKAGRERESHFPAKTG